MISINTLIDQAKKHSLLTDGSDAKEHLVYLTKLGIFPRAKKKVGLTGKIEGHYPDDSLEILKHLKSLRNKGITWSQIAKSNFSSYISSPIVSPTIMSPHYSPAVYLFIGLLLGFIMAQINSPVDNNSISKTLSVNLKTESQNALIDNNSVQLSEPIYILTLPNNHIRSLPDKENLTLSY